jgi:NADPH-dependent ferric siderophore reductase
MPAIPAMIADFVEPRFARKCRVDAVEWLAPTLRRIRLAGPALADLGVLPGQEVQFRVDATAFLHYTPSAYDRTGALEMLVFLHHRGPGSRWCEQLVEGRTVSLLGPGGRFRLADARTHVFLGDETCLGLFAALSAQASATATITGAVEDEPMALDWPALANVALPAVVREARRGWALLAWLRTARLAPDPQTAIYLAGHAQTIGLLRDDLRTRLGTRATRRRAGSRCRVAAGRGSRRRPRAGPVAARSLIHTKPYWSDGKRGL